jgi:hypothetical protein
VLYSLQQADAWSLPVQSGRANRYGRFGSARFAGIVALDFYGPTRVTLPLPLYRRFLRILKKKASLAARGALWTGKRIENI